MYLLEFYTISYIYIYIHTYILQSSISIRKQNIYIFYHISFPFYIIHIVYITYYYVLLYIIRIVYYKNTDFQYVETICKISFCPPMRTMLVSTHVI